MNKILMFIIVKADFIFNCGFSTKSDLYIYSVGKHIRMIRNKKLLNIEKRQYVSFKNSLNALEY